MAAADANGCSTDFAEARQLPFPTRFVSLPAPPFGIAVPRDGRWSFVDEMGGHVAVASNGRLSPRVVRTIGVPKDALGNSLTRDGRYLLVADGGDGATVVSVRQAERSGRRAVLGTLSEPADNGAGGAFDVATSPDGRYAFVSVEFEARVAVYDLREALAKHFRGSTYVGSIPVGQLVDGLAVSPDGRWLYAVSEVLSSADPSVGSLSLIRLATAERRPSRSVVRTVTAGCAPVRVTPAPDGRTVWVAARGSDELLAFSAGKLRHDPSHARLAAIRVGEAPVGVALVNRGREVVVADSDRFDTPGARPELTVVRVAAALAHRPALVGVIRTGAFPRDMALEPRRPTLLVGNYGSNQLEAVDLRRLR